MSIFDYRDYKTYIRDSINQLNRRGVITELARAAGCSHSYLSQVLNGKPDLTPDQALATASYFQLTPDESRYFVILVMKARSATPKLAKHFDEQLKELAASQLELKSAVKSTLGAELSSEDRDFYYSSWLAPAVHVLACCPEFNTAGAISSRLGVPTKDINGVLDWLLQRGVLKKNNSRYLYSSNVHLPTASLHNRLNHLNWRLRALDSSSDPSTVHYTSIFSIDRKDADKLRASLLEFIEGQRAEISKSGSEDAMAFCCDLFGI